MTRERRWSALGHGGATLWFTGLPGAGKSTVAAAVEERLIDAGPSGASCSTATTCATASTATSASTRPRARENVRRTAHVARLLAESGTIALVSLVSPYAADRETAAGAARARRARRSSRCSSTRRSSCARSATRRASTRGRAPASWPGMTGVGAPYEPPDEPRPRARQRGRNGRAGGRARASSCCRRAGSSERAAAPAGRASATRGARPAISLSCAAGCWASGALISTLPLWPDSIGPLGSFTNAR